MDFGNFPETDPAQIGLRIFSRNQIPETDPATIGLGKFSRDIFPRRILARLGSGFFSPEGSCQDWISHFAPGRIMPGLMRQVRIYGPRWPGKSGFILFKPGAATSDAETCRNLMFFFLKEVPHVFCWCVLLFGFFLATFIVSCQGAKNNLLLVLNMFETHSGLKTKISAN